MVCVLFVFLWYINFWLSFTSCWNWRVCVFNLFVEYHVSSWLTWGVGTFSDSEFLSLTLCLCLSLSLSQFLSLFLCLSDSVCVTIPFHNFKQNTSSEKELTDPKRKFINENSYIIVLICSSNEKNLHNIVFSDHSRCLHFDFPVWRLPAADSRNRAGHMRSIFLRAENLPLLWPEFTPIHCISW